MKNKLLWVCGIGAGVIVIAVIALSLAVKSYLKSEKLKTLIVPKVEEFTGRKAEIESINVSLFRGITVRGINLKDRDGKREFIRVKEFVLEYSLLPLLNKRLVIKRIDLISPSVFLLMEKDGRMNFSDILAKLKEGKKGEMSGGDGKGLPFSIETDRISVRDAKLTFRDEEAGFPAADIVSDMDLKLSAEKGQAVPGVSGEVKIKELTIKGQGGEIKGSGTVTIGTDAIEFRIKTDIDNDKVNLKGDVKDYRQKPVARVDIDAPELDLARLMTFSGSGKETADSRSVKGTTVRRNGKGGIKKKSGEEESAGLTASGEVRVGAVKYKGFVLKDFSAGYNYTDGNIAIKPVSAAISGEKGISLQGAARGELTGSTTGMEGAADSLKRSLSGKFSVDLTRCEMKESKIGEAIALFTGVREIASPKFDKVHFIFTIGNERVLLDGTMTSSLMTLNPSGAVGFDKKMDVVADLRVAPGIAGGLVTGSFMRHVKDEEGWTVVPLRIAGTTDKPSVGINKARVGKQLQKGVTKEIENRLFKGIFGR